MRENDPQCVSGVPGQQKIEKVLRTSAEVYSVRILNNMFVLNNNKKKKNDVDTPEKTQDRTEKVVP